MFHKEEMMSSGPRFGREAIQVPHSMASPAPRLNLPSTYQHRPEPTHGTACTTRLRVHCPKTRPIARAPPHPIRPQSHLPHLCHLSFLDIGMLTLTCRLLHHRRVMVLRGITMLRRTRHGHLPGASLGIFDFRHQNQFEYQPQMASP